VGLIGPGALWWAAAILDRSPTPPLLIRELTDGRLLFVNGLTTVPLLPGVLAGTPDLLITMNYLDDSVVAAQWVVSYQGDPGALTVYGVHQAIKCRDGSAHAPGYPCV
jgi:hypothetical protein